MSAGSPADGGGGAALDGEISAEVVANRSLASGRRTSMLLSWRSADPLAVVIDVVTTPEHPALPRGRWTVLRDFLRYGLEEPTGDGHVRIRPGEESDEVTLELRTDMADGPRRPCRVVASAPALRAFLDRTEQVVPTGSERSEPALSALIERLLRESGG